jgi:UDP-N-acetylglucosamine--N-acetylmuramyl-(pentapeptide) pyrophosphoryl-undecaprenol N-acetylglucosamine transferase
MRILLTGGGTAGHAWPIILIAKSLIRNRRAKILYVGSRQGIEKDLIKKCRSDFPIPFRGIMVGKSRPYFSFSNYWDIFKTLIGIIQAFFIIISFRPDVIFAKGGYVTFPIIFWLGFFKIPLVIHESDVMMGRANLWASRKATKICLGFPIEYYQNQDNLILEKLVYTGTPVNPEFLQPPLKSGEKLKILITGGSQGSAKINQIILEILPNLLEKYEVYHLVGAKDFAKFPKIPEIKKAQSNYHLYEFSNQMPALMRDADLVISRAGAGTLMEIAACSKPSIIIPLKAEVSEHQEANAKVFQDKNAAVVLSEKNLTASSLLSIIDNLMSDEELRKLLGHHAHRFFQPQAIEEIIDIIFESAHDASANFKTT